MKINVKHNNNTYILNVNKTFDISIPLDFNGQQPNFYNVNKANVKPLKTDVISWSVKENAPCNVPEISLNIHCSSTHTESVGHLLSTGIDIGKIVGDILIPSLLITIEPELLEDNEKYHVKIKKNEFVISKNILKDTIDKFSLFNFKGLIVRTLPNSIKKKQFYYPDNPYPFFTNDAIKYLNSLGIKHLFVDTPSIDRYDDDGILGNHRLFWNLGNTINDQLILNSNKTITEFCYIKDVIKNGFYFVNLQLPHFQLDAAPSRPILIETIKV